MFLKRSDTFTFVNTAYLFVLGSHPTLSRAELSGKIDEILFDDAQGLLLAENLRFENPREIPRAPEQLFLDQVGGVIRMGEVLGEFQSKQDLIKKIGGFFEEQNKDGTQYVGVSSFGTGRAFLPEFLSSLRRDIETRTKKKVRIENRDQRNLESGQIFQAKLLKKGAEFLIWQRGTSFLLARTVANQNIRNYTLRDRAKGFRDAHMGMMPPKLAQILVQLATQKKSADFSQTVVDPFCGSGTTNGEAAIIGYKTVGSDRNSDFVAGAETNFSFLSEKFRYEKKSADFFVSQAQDFPWGKYTNAVVATEGWLGENFISTPSKSQIDNSRRVVEKMWKDFFINLSKNAGKNVDRVVFCLPCWQFGSSRISISEKIFANILEFGYAPPALFDKKKTYIYARPGAFVAREICVVDRVN